MNSKRSADKIGIKLLLLTLLVTAAVFAWTSSQHKTDSTHQDTWVDNTGHLHVLGITLQETTLRQAEAILKSRSDTALYIYPREHPAAGMTLEAFFPAIADHSKVILLLDADIDLLHDIETRATRPHLYPNNVARMNLSPEDIKLAQKLPIRQLTLIPSVSLDRKNIEARFGKADSEETLADGRLKLLFAAPHLEVVLAEDRATHLHFSNPVPRYKQR
ncbi:MAG: hypothetical protein Q9M25_03520 [Mariprofundaceae bacterium]|nr:hypothetical protein [Mariprofundaceae bacterium]